MKKIILTLLVLLSSLNAIEWMSYEQAIQEASKQDKFIMLMIGRESCGVCQYMKDVVFEDKNVAKKLEKSFLSVYIEVDFDDIPKGLTYIGTPTFHFLDKNEKAIYRFDGGKNVFGLMKVLNKLH